MRFAALGFAHLVWLLPALLALYLYAFARRHRDLALFIDLGLLSRLVPNLSRGRQWCKALLLLAAIGCLVVALMQPQWGQEWQEVRRQGRDMMILLDVSRSMLAEDIAPNRLARAKSDIQDLVRVLHNEGGHRLGLIVFAGQSSLQCPLTLDYGFFLQQLRQVGPQTVQRGGTLIGDAIRKALSALSTLDNNFKDIILITDGEDHESFPLEAAKAAAAQHVSIYTIGVGDALTGTRIPLEHPAPQRGYLQYQGQEVRSRMQTDLLLEIARTTGGAYVPAGTRAIELDKIYLEKIAPKAWRQTAQTRRERFIHRYQWFVLAGVLCIGLEMLWREGREESYAATQQGATVLRS
ncbi:MAG: VWA domain-containing protein [Candidatus Tectomicrobia bacterium]|uniref:VWA domain-containing protein n=1 Tax=Tectimicrobiota bacterium TaxID=2528274 RepID=A0A937W1P9_UNCTE|nr:VWA domain-containing protein [Candidatus Tectomicrobia bacterium]